jgi:beta-mannosidase
MLQGTAGFGLATMLDSSAFALGLRTTTPVSLDLAGNMWFLHLEGGSDPIRATIPGSTYSNLLASAEIPDPFFGENNDKVQSIAEKGSFFERTFEVPDNLYEKRHVDLVCYGLDTLATLWLNGDRIGTSNNMFRTWTFDIKPHLRRGANHLRIGFDPLTGYVQDQRAAYQQQYGVDLANERSWVRKAPYMWGWDWCRPLLTQGIWRKIQVLGYDVRIADVGIVQNHQADGTVQLEIHASTGADAKGLTLDVQVALVGEAVATAKESVTNDETALRVTIPTPQLWWPNGMGDQPLYNVTVRLKDSEGIVLDTTSCRIGLRTVQVVAPIGDTAMHVRVNGVSVFAKGADWIPADNMPTQVTPELLRWYMSKAAECNFNFLRLWGGGYYEEDELFDLCDELGLMLQFEFKFANAGYPIHDQSWMDNLRQEIEQQTRRCRNHPSIVIWSGNNEIEYFDGYNQLFGDFIGGIVRRLVPNAFYEVGSGAHGSGDIHSWGVWHGDDPVESYLKIEGFVTEFGMQSPPVPATVRAFTAPADRQDISSAVMRYHELDGSGRGIEIIQKYTEANFGRLPANFDDALWLTNINQAWMIRYAVEHWRRDMPRSMAAVIWQYNDCWPCSSWSMVDYYRRAKPLLYQSKHFFAPILVSGLLNAETGQSEIYVTSDRQKQDSGQLRWNVTSCSGEVLRHGEQQIDIPARSSGRIAQLDLSDLLHAHSANDWLVWLEVVVDGRTVAHNTLFSGRPLGLKLTKPNLNVSVSGGENRYRAVIKTDAPALWVWLDLDNSDASYAENFFHLCPGAATEIEVMLDHPVTPFDFRNQLRVRSVYDVAPEMRR